MKRHRWAKLPEPQKNSLGFNTSLFQWKCRRCEFVTEFLRSRPIGKRYGDCNEALVRKVMES